MQDYSVEGVFRLNIMKCVSYSGREKAMTVI